MNAPLFVFTTASLALIASGIGLLCYGIKQQYNRYKGDSSYDRL